MRVRIHIDSKDEILKRFGNQLGAVGEGKARVAMARAVNRAGATTHTAVKRSIAAQTSAPRALINRVIELRRAAHKGGGAIEAVIHATGSEIPLKEFKPRQFKSGTRAKVWGKFQTFNSAFMGPRPGAIATRLRGHVFVRTSAARNPIEMLYGPSIPKEMLKDETRDTFQKTSRETLERRLAHELERMLFV